MNSSLCTLFHLLVEAKVIFPSVILARCHVSQIIGYGSLYTLEVCIWRPRQRWNFRGSAKYLLQVFQPSNIWCCTSHYLSTFSHFSLLLYSLWPESHQSVLQQFSWAPKAACSILTATGWCTKDILYAPVCVWSEVVTGQSWNKACSKVGADSIHILLSSFPQEKRFLTYGRFTGARQGPAHQLVDLQSFFSASGIPSQSFYLPRTQTSYNFIFFCLRTSLSQFVALPERLYLFQAPQNHSCPSIGIRTLPLHSKTVFRNLLLVHQFAQVFQMKHLGIEWVCTELASSCPDPQERFDTPSCLYMQFITHQ